MMGKNHVLAGAGVAGAAWGFTRLAAGKSPFLGELVRPYAGFLKNFLFPDGLAGPVLAGLGGAYAAMYVLGTLGPDMDNPRSILGRRFHVPVEHRTILHSLWPVVAFLCASALRTWLRPMAAFAAGWTAHLICDSFSMEGVRFFWPFRTRRHIFRLYTTGETSEAVCTMAFICLGITGAVLGFLA